MPRMIDTKFSVYEDLTIRNPSGNPIPEDEPVFLLRARDNLAMAAIVSYLNLCLEDGCNKEHIAGIEEVIRRFKQFRKDHRDRMKQPGITRGR